MIKSPSFFTKNNIIAFLQSLIFLLPAALISGPLIPELFISIGSILVIYLIYLENKFFYFYSKYAKFFYFFVFLILASSLVNFNLISLKHSFFYFRFGLLVILILYVLENSKNFLKFFFITSSITFLILFCDAIYQKIFGVNFFGYPLLFGRVSSFFGDELIMGSFLVKMFPIYLYLIFKMNFNNKNFFYFASSICFFVGIYLASSRTSMAIYIFIIILLFFLLKKIKKYFFILILLIFSFFLIINLSSNSSNRLFFHTVSQIFKESNQITFFSIRHQMHYETALRIFKNNLIFGVGPNYFRKVCEKKEYLPINSINKFSNFKRDFDSQLQFSLRHSVNDQFVSKYQDGEIKRLLLETYNKNPNYYFNSISVKKLFNSDDLILDIFLINKTNKQKTKIYYTNNGFKILKNSFDFKKNEPILMLKPEFVNGCNTHPHHIYFQLLAETGIFGFFFLLYIFFLGCFYLFKNLFYKNRDFSEGRIILLIGLLSSILPILPSGNFFNNWYTIVIYFPIAFFIYEHNLDNAKKK